MDGPEGAAARARGWLATRLPARLRLLETRLTLAPGSITDPARVLDYETGPMALEDWPSVYVLPQKLTALRLVEVRPDAGEVYAATYSLRVLAWVRADGYGPTDTLRKRYAVAIREALLERKTMTPAGSGANLDATVDPGSIREDYSSVFTDDAARTIAGVFLDVSVTVAETLGGPTARGTVGTAPRVDTATLPPHPANA